jgi:hypothetical protein
MGNAWLCRAQSLAIGRETNEMEKNSSESRYDMVVGFADLISAPLVHRTARKRHSLLSFSYVCPEPVLAKRSFSLYKKWRKKTPFIYFLTCCGVVNIGPRRVRQAHKAEDLREARPRPIYLFIHSFIHLCAQAEGGRCD